jgi:tetratricopeptide (TPR) repeat protein
MYSNEQAQRITSPPSLDLLTASQAKTVADVLDDLTKSNFDSLQIRPQLPALTARIGSVCVSNDDQGRMADELDRWVRWRRLRGYWLAFLFQQAMAQQKSSYFVVGCVLYAQAQINANADLSLPSLENAYNALEQYPEPYFRETAAQLEALMRVVFAYYRGLYAPTAYDQINPLTVHLYSRMTWNDLVLAHPELQKRRRELTPKDYQAVIDQCTRSHDTYGCVQTRRFLGSVFEGLNQLDNAADQFRLALEAAKEAAIDTEIGHLHRLYGYVLRNSGHLDEAANQFQQAYNHESHPLFAYWQALSARELGDVWLRRLLRTIDRSNLPKETLAEAIRWYKTARQLFDAHVAQCVLPAARAVEQQLFRSYVDNGIEVAVLASSRDSIAEVETSGPRYATDVVAEAKAATSLGADASSKFLQSRAVFHEHLATFHQGNFDQDFRDYLAYLKANREARQFYMKTRIQLTARITHAQLSDEITTKIFDLRLPNVAFLLFHIASQETYTWLFFPGVAMPVGKARRQAITWQECDRVYQNVLQQAQSPPSPDPAPAMRQAIDTLLALYGECFSPFLEPGLAALQGRQLKIFPRFSMNVVPFHALKVRGKPLIEYCDVSYGQTLGMFFQNHRDTPSLGLGTLAAVYDEPNTRYGGTFGMLAAAGNGGVSMLPTSSWEDLRAALASRPPSDLFFACHGEYKRDDPAKSLLYLREGGPEVQFSEIFSRLDLTGCRSVTLGACESGIARTLVAAEYIGLPVALFAAGAQYVIATLWQTPQISAAILLGHHYRFLRDGKHTVVAALNEAQRVTMKMSQAEVMNWLTKFLPQSAQDLETYIRSMEDPPFAHPYYWAGFYVAGDV